MNVRYYTLFLFIGLTFFSVRAQQVQWANKVVAYSSEKGILDPYQAFKSSQILGKPNALYNGKGKLSEMAWAAETPDNDTEEWIKVGFATPMYVMQIAVAENFNPGAIKEIYAYDVNDYPKLVYKGNPKAAATPSRILNVFLNELTEFEVSALKIVLNTAAVPGFNQLDAVAISDATGPIEPEINLVKDKEPHKIESLGMSVNSSFDEVLPVISPDGNTLYFVRKGHPENISAEDDIWFSKWQGGNWSLAKRMQTPLNNVSHNFVCSVTPDGNTLLLGNAYNWDNTCKGGLSVSKRTANGWSFPEELKIADFYTNHQRAEYFLANNRKILLLSIMRNDSEGDRDLYVSFLMPTGGWTSPKNLGLAVNTVGAEITPVLAADNKTLYFSSNGHPGFGDQDLYVTKRLDDSWTNWSEPVNLGLPYNSADWDAAYSIDAQGEYAYFASYKGGSGDLYRVKLPQDARPFPVVVVVGTVYNAKTNTPISAEIVYEKLPDGEEMGKALASPTNGQYKATLPLHELYGFYASANGFMSQDQSLDLSNVEESGEVKLDLYMVPIEIGQVIRLNNLFFTQSKADMLPESFPELDRFCTMLAANPSMVIAIEGHTDISGHPADNMRLSELRVQAVKNYFVQKGIDAKRLQTKAFGSTQPLTTDRYPESQKLNRRVEIRIVSN